MPKRIGVIGSLVWDVIHGRGRRVPIQEWGGIGYALAGLDAALPDDWEIVPIIKVGDDLASEARSFLGTLRHMARGIDVIEVPYATERVELHYFDDDRRSEIMSGGVPGWNWLGLKPVLASARLDALYINFLSGWELDLETAQFIRQFFHGPIYCDVHMLAWAIQPDGLRTLRPVPNVAKWCACFDLLQMNEAEMSMLAPDPMALAATALANGVQSLTVTLGQRGVVYFAPQEFDRITDIARPHLVASSALGGPLRTALVPVDHLAVDGDPTGCGDVWGATYFSRLLAGDNLGDAMHAAHRAAALNVEHRGATGLADHLRGTISLT